MTIDGVGQYRHVRLRRDLHGWCERQGLTYHSPHEFRHGHARYSLQQADAVADLKAISQNLMHANFSVTDSNYSILDNDDVKERISNSVKSLKKEEDIRAMLEALMTKVDGLSNRL